MGLVYAADATPGWRVCGWLPMIVGLLVALLAWWSRTARWLHLRISEQGKPKMMLSFPLPLTLASWVVRIIQPFVPKLKETAVDDLIIALRDSTSRGEPFFLDVEDDEEGEHVQVYWGNTLEKEARKWQQQKRGCRSSRWWRRKRSRLRKGPGCCLPWSRRRKGNNGGDGGAPSSPRWFRDPGHRPGDRQEQGQRQPADEPGQRGHQDGRPLCAGGRGGGFDEVVEQIKSGAQGKIIDVEDVEDGERVEIYVE